MKVVTKRFLPGQDVKKALQALVKEEQIQAGVILSAVGSVSALRLRVADGVTVKEWKDYFEIVSLVGTLSKEKTHVHLSGADQDGHVIGGHLKEGCVIHTTLEIAVGVFEDRVFSREMDDSTGYEELKIELF